MLCPDGKPVRPALCGLALSALLCLVLAARPTRVLADSWVIRPGLDLQESYNDNLFFQGKNDFQHLIVPSLFVEYSMENLNLEAGVVGEFYLYNQQDEYNRANGQFVFNGEWGFDERWGLTWETEASLDHTYESSLIETGIVSELVKRFYYRAEPTLVYALDERTQLSAGYSFIRTDYEKRRYPDNTVNGGNLMVNHQLEKDRLNIFGRFNVQQAFYEPEQGRGTQLVYQLMGGLEYKFSEVLSAMVSGGGSLTDSDYVLSDGTHKKETDPGFLADARITYKGEVFQINGGAARYITQSIYGEDVTVDRFNAGLAYQFAERLSARAWTGFAMSQTEGMVQDKRNWYYAVSPALQYDFTEDIYLLLGYKFEYNQDRINKTTKTRNEVYLMLSTEFPFME